jgi:hypothetical protein
MATTVILSITQNILGIDLDSDSEVWDSFVSGWASFGHWQEILPLVVNVLLAVLLMLPLVYRQRGLGRTHSLVQVEHQKAAVIFAGVSAAIAVLVLEHPAMALVVFGMGGLLRFRTPTGSERGTGRAVFAVTLGLACGLSLYALAIIIAILGYVGMSWMEGRYTLELTAKKLSPGRVDESLEAYQAVLEGYGCQVIGTKTSPAGDQFTMVLLVPRSVSLQAVNEDLKRKVPDDLRGKTQVELGD